jgi:hypothetical protein
MSFVYLAASLPLLSLDRRPPMSLQELQRSCDGLLAPEQRAELENMLWGRIQGMQTRFGRTWADYEAQLENECARKRSNRPERLRSHAGYSIQVRDIVLDAFNRENPLERERVLDWGRFRLLDELGALNPLGLERVLAFAGQLRLVHRWAALDRELGRKRFQSLVEQTVQQLLTRTEAGGAGLADIRGTTGGSV